MEFSFFFFGVQLLHQATSVLSRFCVAGCRERRLSDRRAWSENAERRSRVLAFRKKKRSVKAFFPLSLFRSSSLFSLPFTHSRAFSAKNSDQSKALFPSKTKLFLLSASLPFSLCFSLSHSERRREDLSLETLKTPKKMADDWEDWEDEGLEPALPGVAAAAVKAPAAAAAKVSSVFNRSGALSFA